MGVLLVLAAGSAYGDPVKDYEVALAKGQFEIEMKNYGKAIIHLKQALDAKPGDVATMTALGIAYSRNEEYAPARMLLEQVLAGDPQNDRARYELGVVLAHQKEYGEANKLLAGVSAAAGSEELADNARELMEGMRPPKEAGKASLKLAGGLQYDSNVVLEPDRPYIAYPGGKADWRAVLSFFAAYPFKTAERTSVDANYQFYQSLHFQLEDYNVQQHDLSVTGRYTFSPAMQAVLQAGAVASFVGGDKYGSQFAVRPSLNAALMERSRTQFSLGWEDRSYRDSDAFPANSDRSGYALTAGVAHTQMFTKETSGVFEYGYEQVSAAKEQWDAGAHRVAAAVRSRIAGFSVFAGASAADWQYGANPVPSFPDRHDRRWDATVGAYRDLSRSLRVSLANQYVVNDSNLDVYQYRRDIVGVFVEMRL